MSCVELYLQELMLHSYVSSWTVLHHMVGWTSWNGCINVDTRTLVVKQRLPVRRSMDKLQPWYGWKIMDNVGTRGFGDVHTCLNTAEDGHLNILQWLRLNGCPNVYLCSQGWPSQCLAVVESEWVPMGWDYIVQCSWRWSSQYPPVGQSDRMPMGWIYVFPCSWGWASQYPAVSQSEWMPHTGDIIVQVEQQGSTMVIFGTRENNEHNI